MQKYDEELKFWREELDRYVVWYDGKLPSKEFYGVPCPSQSQKITQQETTRLCALETWISMDRWRYCKHLFVEPTYWAGKTVLEIGAGPLGLGRWFEGATVVKLDPLHNEYVSMGYPAVEHACSAYAEAIPFPDDYFDAVYSVNAIDHVDDFAKAISEVERVLKPDGEIRIETHYHVATATEPIVLNDETVRAAFKRFGVSLLTRNVSTFFYPPGFHSLKEQFCVWSNKSHIFDATGTLKW